MSKFMPTCAGKSVGLEVASMRAILELFAGRPYITFYIICSYQVGPRVSGLGFRAIGL